MTSSNAGIIIIISHDTRSFHEKNGYFIYSATDIAESKQIGTAAVDAFLQGVKGKMMGFDRAQGGEYSVSISAKEIALAANAVRSVPRHFINEKGNGVTDECLNYIVPLILGERTPKFENGLPCHVIL